MATWKIEISALAQRQLEKLDPPVARRIEKFLHERLSRLDNPRSIGEALQGSRLGEFWKYRVGDFRLIATIQDAQLLILVLRLGDRKDIYNR